MRKRNMLLIIVMIVAMILLALFIICRSVTAGSGIVMATDLGTLNASPIDIAIAPDGMSIAVVGVKAGERQVVQITNSGVSWNSRRIATPVTDEGSMVNVEAERLVSYCDKGKFIMIHTLPGTIYFVDSQTLRVHSFIALSSLQRQFDREGVQHVEELCSAIGQVVAVRLTQRVPSGRDSLWLFDLDTGAMIANLTDDFLGNGAGQMALSPDGSRLALYALTSRQRALVGVEQGGHILEIIDTRTKTLAQWFPANDSRVWRDAVFAFAGQDALVVGHRPNYGGSMIDVGPTVPSRTIKVLNLRQGGSVRTFGLPGEQAYRTVAGSADGSSVFSYTGREKICRSCNGNSGELKIDDARFTVWNRESGVVLAHSPKLRVDEYKCGFHIGACDDREDLPQLEMSASGNAVVAMWRADSQTAPYKNRGPAIEVFTLR